MPGPQGVPMTIGDYAKAMQPLHRVQDYLDAHAKYHTPKEHERLHTQVADQVGGEGGLVLLTLLASDLREILLLAELTVDERNDR